MIEKATMSPEKRAIAKNDFFAHYIGRPISYVLTIPFLYSPLTPNQVSCLSVLPVVIGSYLMYVGETTSTFVWGWVCFFLWNLLDGVDGNMARYRKQYSKMGSVVDAAAGYVAGVMSPFAWGIAASHCPGKLQEIIQLPTDIYIILGAIAGIFVIYPRLVMHKALSENGKDESTETVKNKAEFGLFRIIALNLVSTPGFMQVIMLLAVIFKMFDVFTISYFFIHGAVMTLSLWTLFKKK